MPPANQAALKGLQEQRREEMSIVMSLRQDRKLGRSLRRAKLEALKGPRL